MAEKVDQMENESQQLHPLDSRFAKLTFTQKDSNYYFKENGDRMSLFVDIPKCLCKKGVHRSQYNQDHLQIQLILHEADEKHASFLDYMSRLEKFVLSKLGETYMSSCIKASPFQENAKIMFLRLDTEPIKVRSSDPELQTLATGKLKILTVLNDIAAEQYDSDFMMEGTLRLSGVSTTIRGLAFMRRATVISNVGPSDVLPAVIYPGFEDTKFTPKDITALATVHTDLARLEGSSVKRPLQDDLEVEVLKRSKNNDN